MSGLNFTKPIAVALLGSALGAFPICAQSNTPVKLVGNLSGVMAQLDPSWAKLKLTWSSPCPAPRFLVITLKGNDPSSRQLDDIGATGETELLLPAGTDGIIAEITSAPCETMSQVEIFATDAISTPLNHSAPPASKPAPAPTVAASVLTKSQIKQRDKAMKKAQKIEEERQAAERQDRMIMRCVRLSQKKIMDLTESEANSLRLCRQLGLL